MGNITSIHSSKQLRRKRQITSRSKPSLGWVWLLSGIFIGIISVIVIHAGMNPLTIHKMKTLTASSTPSHEHTKPKMQSAAEPKPSTETKETPKKYEFYTLLPGMEVPLPASPPPKAPPLSSSPIISSPAKPTPPAKPVLAVKKTEPKPPLKPEPKARVLPLLQTQGPKIQSKLAAAHYIIQAGVFALPKDAKELAIRMEAKGFKPQLHRMKMRNGITAYRVVLGPYPTEVVALQHKKQLEDKKIHGILILKR